MLRFLVRLCGACVAFSLAWRFLGAATRGDPWCMGLRSGAPYTANVGPFTVTMTESGE